MPKRRPTTIAASDVPPPPEPPAIHRAIRLYWYQWPGVAVIALVVLLAVLGVFGHRTATADATSTAIALRVEYPAAFRHGQSGSVHIWLTNRTAHSLDTIRVALDSAWVLRFSEVSFLPSVQKPFEVTVTDVASGETRLIVGQLHAEGYGVHTGDIVASAPGTDTARARVRTRVFP